ncbi:hypothetical protein [Pseudothermotoga sp.]|uniref:hypothetical protein n=1 Tax=Pseudothermotoga sp. TaxID=2033661 RepID=UPI002587A668|nr:hypothetical protein [Pseudothermotoga sp.]MDK2883841.1 hypothetical protein [Pseudothermotoga sp.]
MRFKDLRQFTIFGAGITSFYLLSAFLPLWLSLPLTVFSSILVLFLSDENCSLVIVSPFVLIASFVVAGIAKLGFSQAFLILIIVECAALIFSKYAVPSFISLLTVGIYLSMAGSHGVRFDSLFFAVLTFLWYLHKTKKCRIRLIVVYLLIVLIASTITPDVNFSLLKPIFDQNNLHSEKMRKSENLPGEGNYVTVVRPDKSTDKNVPKDKFSEILEKIWFPSVLIIFGIFLISFALNNFGISGTIKLFLTGAATFLIIITALSISLSFVKPVERNADQMILHRNSIVNDQQSIYTAPATTVVIQREKMFSNKVNIIPFLNVVSVAVLSLVIIAVIYSARILRKKEVLNQKKGDEQEQHIFENTPPLEFDKRSILKAYWWLRRKYFAQYHSKTPHEILDIEGDKNLSMLTSIYVKTKYGRKKLNDEEIKNFYDSLISFCKSHDQTKK